MCGEQPVWVGCGVPEGAIAAAGKAGVAEGYTYNLHIQPTSFMPLLLSTDLRQM